MATTNFVSTVTHVPADWANDVDALVYDIFGGAVSVNDARATLLLGTAANQNANAVAITGGTLDNVIIGGVTPGVGTFSTLNVTSVGGLGTSVPNKAYVDSAVSGITGSLGTMSMQSASGVAITGGVIDGVNIGVTTPGSGSFTALSVSNAPTLGSHATNKTYVDGLISSLPVFGTIVTQNASSITLTGGTINAVVIGGVTPAAGSFTGLVANTLTGPNGKVELNGVSVATAGVYAESSASKPDVKIRLKSGGYLRVNGDTDLPLIRMEESVGRILIKGVVDNGVDDLQMSGGIAASRVILTDAITLATQAATKAYVDTQDALTSGLISAALVAFDATLGTMAHQNAGAVAISGGSIDATVVGGTTAAAGSFTTVVANSISHPTYSQIHFDSSGSLFSGVALTLKAIGSVAHPNIAIETGAGGALYIKGGINPAMVVRDSGRTTLNLPGDDGSSALQVGGDVAITGAIRFEGSPSTGTNTPVLGSAGPMATLTPTWIPVKIGTSNAVIPVWLI